MGVALARCLSTYPGSLGVNGYTTRISDAPCDNSGMKSETSIPSIETATLRSPEGIQVSILNLGATIQKILVPAGNGQHNAVLAYPDAESYRSDPFYIGATIGRFANRIDGARFDLDGEEFTLDANEASTGNCLHGGRDGLSHQIFELATDSGGRAVRCKHESADGTGGFPGTLLVEVTYRLLDPWSLAVDFRATTDRDTIVNLANHAYFNLGGDINEHVLSINARNYTPANNNGIPSGEIRPVAENAFDLRRSQRLGAARFDHNFILSARPGELRRAASLRSPLTGIEMSLYTTQPGLQLYTGDYLQLPFSSRAGLCLEAQGFPDAPNKQNFPSARLSAGETYRQRSIFRFCVERRA